MTRLTPERLTPKRRRAICLDAAGTRHERAVRDLLAEIDALRAERDAAVARSNGLLAERHRETRGL